jgi:hypothetical protein
VEVIRNEPDGDVHLDVLLDPPFATMVNQGNVQFQHGYLVVEIVPADQPGCTPGQPPRPATGSYDYGTCTGADIAVPAFGSRISITGPYVLDRDHGWTEIHPVWSIGPVNGTTVPATAVGGAAGAPAGAPSGPGTCSARMSNPTPAAGADETVYVTSNLPTAAVSIAVHYKTTTHPYNTTTDGSGNATDSFGTGHPTPGYAVAVDVDVAGGAHCETSFTPN